MNTGSIDEKVYLANIGSIARSLEKIAAQPRTGSATQDAIIARSREKKIEMADEVIRDLNQLADGHEDSLSDVLFSAVAVIEALKEEIKH